MADDFERPVLVIASDPDKPDAQTPAASCRALAEERGFPYIAVPGTGHFLQIEQPRRCAREVLDFAARIGLIEHSETGKPT